MLGSGTVLLVGATGHLGGKVLRALLNRGKTVRALVRPGTDPKSLQELGVETVIGDMLDAASLRPALHGVNYVVTTASGHTRHRKSDTTLVDTQGNRNLVDAAAEARVGRFVFLSVLNCHQAPQVPHFWHKKLAEDYLEQKHLPFISLRPGIFIDQAQDNWARGIQRGTLQAFGDPNVRYTLVLAEDVARYVAEAVDLPNAIGSRIDIGCDRPVSPAEVAQMLSVVLKKPVRVRSVSAALARTVSGIFGLFSPGIRDMVRMFGYIQTGQYVADTSAQARLFGQVPTVENALKRWTEGANLAV